MLLKKLKDPYALKQQENLSAESADNGMMIEYLAMMMDVDLPETETQDTRSEAFEEAQEG